MADTITNVAAKSAPPQRPAAENPPGRVRTALDGLHDFFRPAPIYTEPFDLSKGIAPATSHPGPVEPTDKEQEKVFGTVAATVAGQIGSKAGPIVGAILLATAGAAAGPLAAIGLGIVGLGAGYFTGRVGGATVAGTAGVLAAKALNLVGVHVPTQQWLIDETQGFSLKELPKRAANPMRNSHPKMNDVDADHIETIAKPGDILVTARYNVIGNLFRFLLKTIAGGSGTWTHTSVYAGKDPELMKPGEDQPQVLEMHAEVAGNRSLRECVGRQHRVMVLRPQYNSPEEAKKMVDWMKEQQGKKYDYTFSMTRQDKMYCLAMVDHALENSQPDLAVPTVDVFGKPMLRPEGFIDSPKMDRLYSTGGHFSQQYLGQFD